MADRIDVEIGIMRGRAGFGLSLLTGGIVVAGVAFSFLAMVHPLAALSPTVTGIIIHQANLALYWVVGAGFVAGLMGIAIWARADTQLKKLKERR